MSDHLAPQEYPAQLSIEYPEKSSRLLAVATLLVLIKPLILIPHFIILYVLSMAAFVGFIIAQFVVLFTGKYPRPMFMLNKASALWQWRLNAYFMGMADKYPPFSLGLEESERKSAWKALVWLIVPGIILVIGLTWLSFATDDRAMNTMDLSDSASGTYLEGLAPEDMGDGSLIAE